jgi:hypothetical protein
MAKILTCLKKRDLLHNPQAGDNELSQHGQEYLAQERLADALDFFEKARNREGIQQIRDRSIQEGDPFLLQQTSKLLQIKVDQGEWRRAGEKALAEGRLRQALAAFNAIPDEEKIQEIQSLLKA